MTCWASSSTSRRAAAALALALAALPACRHVDVSKGPPPPVRIAVFPVQNATGGVAPIRPITELLDDQLAKRGVEMVSRQELDEVLARHRFRFTGGVDTQTAKALREELGVEAVLIPTLEQHDPGHPPRVALALRMVSVEEQPLVLWADSVARSGEDSPGLLGIGVVEGVVELERQVVVAAGAAVQGWVATRTRGGACDGDFRYKPRRAFRAPVLDDVGRRTIAVLPFQNLTRRRDAQEVALDQIVAELTRSGSFEVLDPGVIREQILANRIILENGVSIDRAMTMLELLGGDLVLSGEVRTFAAPGGARQPPAIELSVYVIDRSSGELVWSSRSVGEGDDWVAFFGLGRVYSTTALTCRIARGVVDGIVGARSELVSYAVKLPPSPQRVRERERTAQFQRRARDANRRDFEQNARPDRARGVNQRRAPQDQAAQPARPEEPSR
jgi:TolB-like protein